MKSFNLVSMDLLDTILLQYLAIVEQAFSPQKIAPFNPHGFTVSQLSQYAKAKPLYLRIALGTLSLQFLVYLSFPKTHSLGERPHLRMSSTCDKIN